MLIDRARIHVKAGSGGDGCTSFYRDRRVRKGKPNGGDGGSGGDVVFAADRNIHTLLDFKYNRHHSAQRGGHGGSNNKKGKRGESLFIRVPVGTVITESGTGLLLRDLAREGESVIVARGGVGGKGNTKHRPGTAGAEGEGKELELELKLIADVGIVGYPNAGKSTFISRVSRAKSKIGNYAFTTKAPILGIVRFDECEAVFADMPGLISGAHRGRGLGDEFLRHIERTRVLIHMVDIAQLEGRSAHEDYDSINGELSLYKRSLARKPQVIACNKIDISGSRENFSRFCDKIGKSAYPVSALTGEGIDKLLEAVFRCLSGQT